MFISPEEPPEFKENTRQPRNVRLFKGDSSADGILSYTELTMPKIAHFSFSQFRNS